jgi:hypothetical protein
MPDETMHGAGHVIIRYQVFSSKKILKFFKIFRHIIHKVLNLDKNNNCIIYSNL